MKNINWLFAMLLFFSSASALAKETPDSSNSALLAARAANQEKHYADAEALMLNLTASKPDLLYPWIELGTAQKGLNKFVEAEHSFKVALGTAPAIPKPSAASSLNVRPDVLVDSAGAPASTPAVNPFGATVTMVGTRTPEFRGVAYSNLGEIYARTGRIPEAQAAFDEAAKSYPAKAALFRHNEAIFFFKAGSAEAQLDAAQKGIALDPSQTILYYLIGQALVSQASVDPKTQKLVLPTGCADAYTKYLELESTGEFAEDARNILTAAGLSLPANRKK